MPRMALRSAGDAGADESTNVRTDELTSIAVLRLNQRAGTVRTPDYGRRLFQMWFDDKYTVAHVRALIDFLENGERDTKTYRDNQTKLQRLMEMIDMATAKKIPTKKTAAKKGSVFGAEEPKGAVDRPRATVDKNKKPFVPTTPEELKDIEKTAAKKAAAKAPAKKAAAKTKAAKPKTSNVGRKSRIDGTKKITVLVDANPKREGSGAHARFAKYKTGITVSKALELGVTTADLAYDAKNKYISIA